MIIYVFVSVCVCVNGVRPKITSATVVTPPLLSSPLTNTPTQEAGQHTNTLTLLECHTLTISHIGAAVCFSALCSYTV